MGVCLYTGDWDTHLHQSQKNVRTNGLDPTRQLAEAPRTPTELYDEALRQLRQGFHRRRFRRAEAQLCQQARYGNF